MSVAECCRKNCEEKLSSKIGVRKCCSKVGRTKPFLGTIRSGILPEKLRRKTIVKNRRTEMLPKKTAKKNYCQNRRSKMLPMKNYRRNRCTEMLIKSLPYEIISQKKSVAECCRKNCEEKLSWKIERTEMLLGKVCRTKNFRLKYP